MQAQTPQQRRANLKFAKEQEARRGKSSEELKKRNKETPKSPISPIWLSMSHASSHTTFWIPRSAREG